ncbi:MAG: DUF4292 domain-containing protein [bacterium]
MRIVILFLTTALLAGCPCTLRRSYTTPTGKDLLQTLAERDQRVRSMRAKVKVDQWTTKGRVKVRVYILTTAAGQLRFEAVSPFDTALVTLASDGAQFSSIDHKNNIYYSGPAKPCNIARVFGLALEPREVARALSGGAPVLRHDKVSLSWSKCKGAEVLKLEDQKQQLVQRIWMKRERGRYRVLQSTVHNAKGQLLFELKFEKFRRISGRMVPRVIKFRQPQRKADVIIRFAKQELNVSIPAEAFRLTAPPGIPERLLTCP